jgi:hypothetical protein
VARHRIAIADTILSRDSEYLAVAARQRYAVHCRQMLILCALFDGLIGFSDVYDWWRPTDGLKID